MIDFKRLPYPGLRAFTREESDLFFGRDGCVDAMVDRLGMNRFLAVLGPSGSGKSSLVRTGLLDTLELGLLSTAGSRWRIADLHPGGQPMRKLSSALLNVKAGTPSDGTDLDLMVSFLRRGPRSVIEWAGSGNIPADSNLLILVDQFEELFRYADYAQREEAEAFVAMLIESSSSKGVPIYVVITMRSEYLGACASIERLAERISEGLYLTPRMGREECREAIEGPASVLGFKVEPALVNQMLNDLASFSPWEASDADDLAAQLARQADQLPLMQHVLNRLWLRAEKDSEGEPIELKRSEYDEIGGLSGALDAHGAAVIAELGQARMPTIESVFRTLVSGNSLATAVRRPSRMSDLIAAADGAQNDVVTIVEAFRAPGCNFLRSSDSSLIGKAAIVDISHESLIRQWTPLSQWLEKEASDGATWRRLVSSEDRYSRREGGLLTGLDLQTSTKWWEVTKPTASWAMRHGGRFSEIERFLNESRHAESDNAEAEKRRQRRERNVLLVGVVALMAALVIVTALGLSDVKANRGLKKANANLAEKNIEAAKARDVAEELRSKAEQMDANRKSVLEAVSNVVYSDRYRNLVGVDELQLDLMKALLPYEATISDKTAINELGNSARDEYNKGLSYETIGDAPQALASFEMAYERGRKSMETFSGGTPPEPLLLTFIKDGTRYDWFLFDIGEREKGGQVLQGIETLVEPYRSAKMGAKLLVAFSGLENLESRYYSDLHKPDIAKRHGSKAVEYGQRAVALSERDIEAQSSAFTAFRNEYIDAKGTAEESPLAAECKLARTMISESPMNLSAIMSQVECLSDESYVLRRKGKDDDAAEKLRSAEETAYNGLRADPGNQSLLLALAGLEIAAADALYGKEQDSIEFQHRMAAKDDIVRALKGRTLFQSNPAQIKNLYLGCCQDKQYPNSALELESYKEMTDSVANTLNAFPRAPSFGYVAADASIHVGKLLEGRADSSVEAEGYIKRSIDWFDRSGLIDDSYNFSENFAAYCGAYNELAKVHGAMGRVDLVLHDSKRMTERCTPALDKYPWDIYLRNSFLENSYIAGQALFDVHRYSEAVPYLQYASHWGENHGSKLLARMYREGLGFGKDEAKAKELDTLAGTQILSRFVIPTDFGGIKYPFPIFVRDWPSDYPYDGIDDQVIWLKEARGGTLPPEVIDSFHKLVKIAKDNKVSFRELVEYALSSPKDTKTTNKSATAAADAKTPPAEPGKAQYELALSLAKQQKWPDAAQGLEAALKLDPGSVDALALLDYIYHEKLFEFDRAYEINARRVQLGVGGEDFVEKHLTTSRFEECADLAAVVRDESSKDHVRFVMSSLEFACLSGEGRHDAALERGKRLRKEMLALDKNEYTFTGVEHFISASPAFSGNATKWVSLFQAIQEGDVKEAQAALTSLGVPDAP